MQLIFDDPYYDSDNWNENQYPNELEGLLREYDESLKLHHVDTGHGADFPAILVELFDSLDWKVVSASSVAGVFMLGDKINKNLEAWISIGKKLSSLIEKCKPTRVSEDVAICWVINELSSQKVPLQNIDIRLQVVQFSKGPRKSNLKLEANPDCLYIITIQTSSKVFVYGLKSNLKVEFKKEFGIAWHEF
ncbi:hypothetical protein GNP63_16620 [Aliivibrio fischeri]|uniref:hypothetical protein n=1 Tax=Aliivibrio fischeri TaxID=668 RepID=UPI0012D91AC0|nr:hypothetical protein [Aliivibrio fischeri]MUH98157.1 hypothetical protein [Aliivibrio fischeri]MUI65436.1 hypothetical protein [Aliivibrio fischeri]